MPIIDGLLYTLTLITALGCGLAAGVFYAFSTFVMKALARLPAAQGFAAMQSISDICSPLRSVTERQSTAKEDSGAATLLKATPIT
jgi:uncharacterized membrane protein